MQGYPSSLLSLTVAGIPSMHICLDFIPELISQPQNEKKVSFFAIFPHFNYLSSLFVLNTDICGRFIISHMSSLRSPQDSGSSKIGNKYFVNHDTKYNSFLTLYFHFVIISNYFSVLTSNDRALFYTLCLKPLSRISKAFPPTRDDIISILIQLAQISLGDCAVLGLSPGAGS